MPFATAPRLRTFALLGFVLALAACAAETDEAPLRAEQEGDLSLVSFEATAYFDVSANNARIIERIRREKESVVFALRRQQISITSKKQVDVELKRVIREPVSVVDPMSDTRRPALRVRYWFVGFGGVPAEMLAQKEVPFGLLHTDDVSKEPALAACLVDDPSGKPFWQRFQPSRESCRRAIDDEQKLIDASRQKLGAKEQEIVPLELDRLYVPMSLHVSPRNMVRAKQVPEADAGAVAEGEGEGEGEVQGGVRVKTPEGIDPPSGSDPSPRAATLPDKVRERERERARAHERARAETEDEADFNDSSKLANPSWVVPPNADGHSSPSSFIFNEPNFALLWGVALIMVIIGIVEYRRRQRGRGIPERQARRRLNR